MVDITPKVIIEGRSTGNEATINTISQAATRWRLPYSQIGAGNFAASIVSSSVNDTALGSGARTVEVRGLNTNGLPSRQTFSLNGTTPVSLGNWGFINDVYVASVGTPPLGANEGELTVSSGGLPILSVAAGQFRDYTAVYKVPSTAYLVINELIFSNEGASEEDTHRIRIFTYKHDTQPFAREEKQFVPRIRHEVVPLYMELMPNTILEIAQNRTGGTTKPFYAKITGALYKY